MQTRRILILGGTSEARQLAARLSSRGDMSVTMSLAGRTLDPQPMPVPTRVGGFGGVAGLADYLRREAVSLLIDATHPFADQMARHAVLASQQADVPLVKLDRPAWARQEGDRWISVSSVEDAIDALGQRPRRVFLAIGRQEAAAAARAPQHAYVVRSVDPIDPPLDVPDVRYVLDRGPFSREREEALLRERQIDVLVCKNSGGDATSAKLAAARTLGVEVVMVERKPRLATSTVSSVEELLSLADSGNFGRGSSM